MRQLIPLFLLFSLNISLLSCTQAQDKYKIYPLPKRDTSHLGMVVTAHPAATQVGVDILSQGGNAIDAAIAVHFALAVCYQRAGNIGGGGFLMYREATGALASLDFREKAPLAAARDMYLDKNGKAIDSLSRDGHLAVGVPGSVAGMWAMHQKYGSLPWSDLVAPSIILADSGVILTNWEATTMNEFQPIFNKVNRYQSAFQLNKGASFKRGDIFVQKDLANTLKRIQTQGRDGFYKGETAQLIVEEMQAKNGLITKEDLELYQPQWREPIQFKYKNYQFASMPPPSSGGVLIAQLFAMIEKYPLAKYGFQSVESVHLITEAERRAYADRSMYLGDPDFYQVPVRKLLDSNYLQTRIKNFNPQKASPSSSIKAGELGKESEETTHYSIVDKAGNAVAITTTVNTNYGSKVIVKGGGFILNNEMDDFSAKPNSPNHYGLIGGEANAIVPQKRMLSSMTPTIIAKEGKLFMLLGSPGGSTIPTSVFQVIINVIEYKKTLQEAVDARRFHHQYLPDKIQHEKNTFSAATIRQLRKMGHTVEERKAIGQVEAILIHPDGLIEGVADRRADDAAKGVSQINQKNDK